MYIAYRHTPSKRRSICSSDYSPLRGDVGKKMYVTSEELQEYKEKYPHDELLVFIRETGALIA